MRGAGIAAAAGHGARVARTRTHKTYTGCNQSTRISTHQRASRQAARTHAAMNSARMLRGAGRAACGASLVAVAACSVACSVHGAGRSGAAMAIDCAQ